MGLGFGVLGPLQLTANGTLLTLGTPKQRAVLAMLVINRNRPVRTRVVDRRGVGGLAATGSADQPALLRVEPAQAAGHALVSNPAPCWPVPRRGIGSPCPTQPAISAGSSSKRRPECKRPLPVDSNRPATTSRQHWPSGAARCWTICATSGSSNTFATALVEEKIVVHTVRAEAEIACGRGIFSDQRA